MRKKQTERSRRHGFWLVMLIYGVVFLVIACIGLSIFWKYMEAYENSRPKAAINAYMESLTEEHICDLSQAYIDQVDHNIQSTDECRALIMEAIDDINYAKKPKESGDERQVFALRTGKTVIGEFSIVVQEPDRYGFTPWEVESESFDLSALNLLGTGCQVIVPQDHTVTVNGTKLDDSYITGEMIPYEEIKEYYEDYDLPYRVTYSVAPILGQMDVVITDPAGKEVTFDERTDWTPYFHNCTQEETEALDGFVNAFVERYVAYSGATRFNRFTNYGRLAQYVVDDSDFEKRLYKAIDSLEFGQTRSSAIISVVTNHLVRLEEGRYLCDVTYELDVTGNKGVVRTSTNIRVIAVQTDDGLKAESMNIY